MRLANQGAGRLIQLKVIIGYFIFNQRICMCIQAVYLVGGRLLIRKRHLHTNTSTAGVQGSLWENVGRKGTLRCHLSGFGGPWNHNLVSKIFSISLFFSSRLTFIYDLEISGGSCPLPTQTTSLRKLHHKRILTRTPCEMRGNHGIPKTIFFRNFLKSYP